MLTLRRIIALHSNHLYAKLDPNLSINKFHIKLLNFEISFLVYQNIYQINASIQLINKIVQVFVSIGVTSLVRYFLSHSIQKIIKNRSNTQKLKSPEIDTALNFRFYVFDLKVWASTLF